MQSGDQIRNGSGLTFNLHRNSTLADRDTVIPGIAMPLDNSRPPHLRCNVSLCLPEVWLRRLGGIARSPHSATQ